jgi:hypothetical protein
MVGSVVLAGPAFASPAAGKRQDADHAAQRRDQDRALARLVLSPAGASIRAGTSQTYTATGYDAAGHALGNLTGQTSFSISPEGSCTGASCTVTQRGRHTITGTVRHGNRTTSGTAALQVVVPPSPVAPPRRPVERPRAPAAPPRHPVQPRHSPIKRPHDPVTPPRRQVEPARRQVETPRRQGEPGRSRVEPPRGPGGSQRLQAGRRQPLAHLELDPAREFITPGESLTYTAWLVAADNSRQNVTDQTTFSIRFSAAKTSRRTRPDGSCTDNVCTAIKLGRHTVTSTLDLGDRTISGTAALQVVPRHRRTGRPHQVFTKLELRPNSATIQLGEDQRYRAFAKATDRRWYDVTAWTTFTHTDGATSGSCSDAACRPPEAGQYTIAGTFPQPEGRSPLSATATLLVLPRSVVIEELVLKAPMATIQLPGSQSYTAIGIASDGSRHDVTAGTDFTMSPDGSCARAGTQVRCTPTAEGKHLITGRFTQRDGPSPLVAHATLLVLRLGVVIERLELQPSTATIQLGREQPYRAIGYATDGSTPDLTTVTEFTIEQNGKLSGSCFRAGTQLRCTPNSLGEHTVTGTFTQSTGPSPLTATATLLVVDKSFTRLRLEPEESRILVGHGGQDYTAIATATDGGEQVVTAATTFTFQKAGSRARPCTGATCDPPEVGTYTITGRFTQPEGSTLEATATLLVAPPVVIERLELVPLEARIRLSESQDYRAFGYDTNGQRYDLTRLTEFTFQQIDGAPSGPCPNARCRPPEVGTYTITGRFTQPDGPSPLTAKATLAVEEVPFKALILEPSKQTILLGESQAYIAWAVAPDNSLHDVSAKTTFTMSPDGSCARAGTQVRCTPTAEGKHLITGRFTQRDGPSPLTATAILHVVRVFVALELEPREASIELGEDITYTAIATASDHSRHVVTDQTTFTIDQGGSCTGNVCRPITTGDHTVTATFRRQGRPDLTAIATLHVVRRPPVRLELAPSTATIKLGRSQPSTAWAVAANSRQDVTNQSTFTISPSGSCTANICTPTQPGRHTVTGTYTPPGRPTLTDTAALLVLPPPVVIEELVLKPPTATIQLPGSQAYTAIGHGSDGKDYPVTAATTFTISKNGQLDGSCAKVGDQASCTPVSDGLHLVTGILSIGGRHLTAKAALLVVPQNLARLELHPQPDPAVINPGGKVAYTVHGLDTSHTHLDELGDLAPFTSFMIDGGGSCTDNICTATRLGRHTVTGALNLGNGQVTGKARMLVVPQNLARLELDPTPNPAVIQPGGKVVYRVHGLDASRNHVDRLGDLAPFTSFEVRPDGSCTGATCTATKLGRHTVTATLDVGGRQVTGKATLRVTTGPLHCPPSAGDVRDLAVTPGKGRPGTQVQITAQVNRTYATCPLAIFFGGSRFGDDTTVGPDGSVSQRGIVPDDFKPGPTTVRLATTSGRTLATTSFEVLININPAGASPWRWLLFVLGLLFLLLVVSALFRERARRQRRWVRHHFRAEPHPSADDLTSLDQDSESEPSFSWRLQAHGDAGTQTLKEGDR